jgi:hypothetical protein
MFSVLGVRRSAGFHDDVTPEAAQGDDWLMYKGMALSILDGGWTIPAVPRNYFRPGGFLYNYFVAGVFAATDRNSAYVYLVQSVLLGISIALMTLAFQQHFLAGLKYAMASIFAAAAYVDVFRNYTFRLLSENLLLILLALFWLALTATLRRRGHRLLALACGLLFGLCGLTRPNLIPLAPVIALAAWAKGAFSRAQVALFLVGFLGCTSFMVARNFAVTGQASLAAVTVATYWTRPVVTPVAGGTGARLAHAARGVVTFYGRRLLFAIGLLPVLMPEFQVRPHWLLAWAGAAGFLLLKWRSLEAWEVLVVVFIVGYLGPLVAVGEIESYGYRMIVPVMPCVMLLALRDVDLMLRGRMGRGVSASRFG